jgi:hypothetical protein
LAGETERNVSGVEGWTTETLRAFLLTLIGETDRRHAGMVAEMDLRYEQRFAAQQAALVLALTEADKRYEQRFSAQQEAITKSEHASERRFESVNEFRAQLNDQTNKLMTRTESEAIRAELLGAVKALGDRMEAVTTANTEKIASVTTRLERQEGRDRGIQAGWGYLVAGIGLIATIGTIVAVVLGIQ